MDTKKLNKEFVKKLFALLFVATAIVNLTLLSLGKIEPFTFILVLTFIGLVTFSYYKMD